VDTTSVRSGASSAPYLLTRDGNVLVWRFGFAALPDSAADPVGSRGFVRFTVNARADLPPGSTISNRAWVQMDDRPAVLTPLVENRFGTSG